MKTTLWFALVLGALSTSGKVIFTKVGQKATVPCGFSYFRKTLEWRHENVRITEAHVKSRLPQKGPSAIADRSRLVGMSLYINNVKQEDAGTFTCQADGKSQQHTLVVVSVLGGPSSKVQLGSVATIQCQVGGLPPQATVQWIRPDGSPATGSQTHTLKPVALSDAGTWKCKVSHSGEEFTSDLELTIIQPTPAATSAPTPPKKSADGKKPSCVTCVSHIPPDAGDQLLLLGLSWWMWVVIGVGCLIVVLLTVLVICLCKKIRRKKRKLRMQKIQNGRQPRRYCQCNRPTAAAKPQQGRRREKPSALPLQPLLLE